MLKGITILDFTQYLPGPYATMRLADMGANVIKIEPPHGDPARALGNGIVFAANNRNKKSVIVNLKDEQEKKGFIPLIKQADIIVESFRPGVMDKLGIGYEAVRQWNEDIIYCSITGYGQTGSYRHLGSHDLNYMALSGMLDQLKDENGRPVHPTTTIADLVGGLALSEAVLAALYTKERCGKGTKIDLAITDALLAFQTTHLLYAERNKRENGIPVLDGTTICYHLYETKDGRWMSIAALEEKFWRNFCAWAQKPHWLAAHHSKANDDNPIYQEVKEFFQSYTLEEWKRISHKVDACLAPVLNISEVMEHPYPNEKRHIFSAPWGDVQVKAAPFLSNVQRPPKLGEDQTVLLTKKE